MKKNDQNKQGNAEFSKIKPAEILLTRTEGPASGISGEAARIRYRWLWPLAALLFIAAGVVFFLPRMIDPPVLQTTAVNPPAAPAGDNNASRSSPPAEASPWREAQLARERSRSQELLSQLLKRQEELEGKNVKAWGAESYHRIMALAGDGDAAYRQRDFQQAATLYDQALDGMTSLLEAMEDMFAEAVGRGQEALNGGNSTAASAAFERALLMKPDDGKALAGLRRASTLDEVLKLITEGNDLQLNSRLEPALEKYKNALAIDQFAEEARRQIKNTNEKILNRDFNRFMSEGYARLQDNDLEKAKSHFERAIKLKPGADEATAALTQTRTRMTNRQINALLEKADVLEKQEQWQEAVVEYGKALALDNALAQAQEGRQYAASRAALDGRLEKILAEPARLTNKAVYEESRLIYQQASTIASPETRLASQLASLKNLLDLATVPVEVAFRSDNQTEVTLYKVGKLGKFEETHLTLLPGEYIAVGTRQGYRDVRVQFTVEADNPPRQPVLVSAVEKIASR